MAGLIGTNYIGLDLGTPGAPVLTDGAELRTKVTPDLNAIMADLGNLGQNSTAPLARSPTASAATAKIPAFFKSSTGS